MKSDLNQQRPFVSVIIPVGTETEIGFYKRIYSALASEDGSKEVVWVSSNQQWNQWVSGQRGARLIVQTLSKRAEGIKCSSVSKTLPV